MKRIHLHFNVNDLDESVRYYTALLGANPSIRKADYAKWLLDDPGLNLAVSTGSGTQGLSHLGVQVDRACDLERIRDRLTETKVPVDEEADAHCCYARSDKVWSRDPAGVVWESFLTHAVEQERDGAAHAAPRDPQAESCCA